MSETQSSVLSAAKLCVLSLIAFLGIGFGIVASRTTVCFVLDNPFLCEVNGTSLLEVLIAAAGAVLFFFWYTGRIGEASSENKVRIARLFTALAATPFTLWLVLYLAFGNY